MVVRRLCSCRSWRNFRGNTRNDSWSRPCSHKCRCHRGCRTRHGEGAVESVVMCLGYGCGLAHSVSLCQIRFGINIPANVTSGEKPVWRACIRKGQYFSCPMRFPARARAHHPRARASLYVTLSTRAPLQSARSRRRQAAGISRRDRRMAPRGAVLRPRRFAPERCRGCSAILGVVIGEAGRSAGAKATTVARTSYTEHKERDA